MMKDPTITALILVMASSIFAQQPIPDRFQKIARSIVEAFNSGDFTDVKRDFSQQMLDAAPPDKLAQFAQDLRRHMGRLKQLEPPTFPAPHTAVFTAKFERGMLDMTLTLDNRDKIIGLRFDPHAATAAVKDKNATALSLPFKSAWLVFWGGDTRELNYHHDTPNQRYAFDFLMADEKGQTHRGSGAKNEDYYAFEKEVLTPADGVVIEVITGVKDNLPGSTNPYSALGNAVLIQHGEGEVSVLAHLKNGSTKVQVGDKLRRGQVIGLCGNSGNSSEPHLHYHLQNSPVIQEGVGIKCYFQTVIAVKRDTGEKKMNYSPVKGDIISNE
jgi:hypothetical protein